MALTRSSARTSLGVLVWALSLSCAALTGCGDDSATAASDANNSTNSSTSDNSANSPGGATTPTNNSATSAGNNASTNAATSTNSGTSTSSGEPLGTCIYTNPFSQGTDCKAYTGAGWTVEAAEADCANAFAGAVGAFEAGGACGFDQELGTCTIAETDGDGRGYQLVSEGSDASQCGATETACTVFLSGAFEGGSTCEGGGGPADPTQGGVFTPFAQVCKPPIDGEPAGAGPNGEVCTWEGISACTEPGRKYDDYASCDPIFTQRPYYPYPSGVEPAGDDDPRLQDAAYMEELAWVTEQIEACACVCCHTDRLTPNGVSGWSIDAGPLWIDTVTDSGLSMFAGFADSTSFGAFDPADNNGFDRNTTGIPTTDIDRMRAFLTGELERRQISREQAESYPPFGGPLHAQLTYEPEACDPGIGVAADGSVMWPENQQARYVYVLSADAENPLVPPNLDLPEGTLWRLDVPPDQAPVEAGIAYGAAPDNALQAFPEIGAPNALQDGMTYYLYVLRDIGLPITRCLFTYEGS